MVEDYSEQEKGSLATRQSLVEKLKNQNERSSFSQLLKQISI